MFEFEDDSDENMYQVAHRFRPDPDIVFEIGERTWFFWRHCGKGMLFLKAHRPYKGIANLLERDPKNDVYVCSECLHADGP